MLKLTEKEIRKIVKEAIIKTINEGQGSNYFFNRLERITSAPNDEVDKNLKVIKSPAYQKRYKQDFIDYGDFNYHENRSSGNVKNYYDEQGEPSNNPKDKPINTKFWGRLGRWASLKGLEGATKFRKLADVAADPRWSPFSEHRVPFDDDDE